MALPFFNIMGSFAPQHTIDGYDINSPSVAQAPASSITPGPTNPPGPTGPPGPNKTITGVDTSRDAAGNLVQTITYSDGTTDTKIIEPARQIVTQTTEQDVANAMTAERRQSAFEVMKERFSAMGLTSLATEIEKIFKGEAVTRIGKSPIPIPTSDSGFYLALIETEAYYERFGKLNEARIKSGYTALDERTILGMEDEYQKIMKAYNMPSGFYDKPEDFQTFLANDLSELELADRLQASRQFAAAVDPTIKNQLKSVYNIDESALSAFIADPVKGQQVLNQLATKSLTGAAAILSGLTQEAATRAEGFGAGEMRFAEQQRRFGQAATLAERGQFLSEIDKSERAFGEQEAVEVAFGGLESSIRAAERLASRERARFGGAAGTTTSSFTRPTAGQF